MKIMVVDDSLVYRSALKQALLSTDLVSEVLTLRNGKEALRQFAEFSPDGISLDLEMPEMDGLETLKALRKLNASVPIIMFSAQTMTGAAKTLEAMKLGASDFVQKIESNDPTEGLELIKKELIPRFKALVKNKHPSKSRQSTTYDTKSTTTHSTTQRQEDSLKAPSQIPRVKNEVLPTTYDLIIVASSTGGPETLRKAFIGLPKLKAPMLIVQHMPPVFTTQFANTLKEELKRNVYEATHGMMMEQGGIYLAPGDYHLSLGENNLLRLNQGPKECFVRPAADVLFRSVADSEYAKKKILCMVFTGMGQDGLNGVKYLKSKCDYLKVVIQDQASCVVWGMPKAIYDHNLQNSTLSLDEIKSFLSTLNS